MAKRKRKKVKDTFDERPRLARQGRVVKDMATAFERIQKLQEQIEEAKNQAIEELKEKRDQARRTLADIEKQIAELAGAVTRKARGSRKSSSEAVCPICQIPGHDGRAHRSQGKNKKAFTKEELREKGFAA